MACRVRSDRSRVRVHAVEATARSHDENPLACSRDATSKATKLMGEDLKNRILAAWERHQRLRPEWYAMARVMGDAIAPDAASLSLHATGVGTLSQLLGLFETLNGVRGVQSVRPSRFQGSEADFYVVVQGGAEVFAAELKKKVVKGKGWRSPASHGTGLT